jgi:hypothetical protein
MYLNPGARAEQVDRGGFVNQMRAISPVIDAFGVGAHCLRERRDQRARPRLIRSGEQVKADGRVGARHRCLRGGWLDQHQFGGMTSAAEPAVTALFSRRK